MSWLTCRTLSMSHTFQAVKWDVILKHYSVWAGYFLWHIQLMPYIFCWESTWSSLPKSVAPWPGSCSCCCLQLSASVISRLIIDDCVMHVHFCHFQSLPLGPGMVFLCTYSHELVQYLIYYKRCSISFSHCVFLQDFMGKSDPYLEFSRQMPDGKFVAVHRTEVFTSFFLM